MLEELSLHTPMAPPRAMKATLPMGSLKQLDLDAELYDNYREAKEYLDVVLNNENIPPNQVAQTMNTLTTILKEIVKTQTEVHNAERVKKLENAMITALKLTTEDIQNAFFAEFERLNAMP